MHFMNKRFEETIPGTHAYMEKRKNDRKNSDIFLLNQRLQKLTPYTPYSFVKEHEALKKALKRANQHNVQCTILQLRYRDNFENLAVAIATAEFLLEAIPYLPEDKQSKVKLPLKAIVQELKRIDPQAARHLSIGR